MKLTPTQRKMAKELIEKKKLSFRFDSEPRSIWHLLHTGCATITDDGWWAPTDKTILATLTPAQYLVAEKLVSLGRINFNSYEECPWQTSRVLGALTSVVLAEHVISSGIQYADYWKPTEKLKKAFAIDDTEEAT